jgi:hypothetical protein
MEFPISRVTHIFFLSISPQKTTITKLHLFAKTTIARIREKILFVKT